jgi:hypothetical protein
MSPFIKDGPPAPKKPKQPKPKTKPTAIGVLPALVVNLILKPKEALKMVRMHTSIPPKYRLTGAL